MIAGIKMRIEIGMELENGNKPLCGLQQTPQEASDDRISFSYPVKIASLKVIFVSDDFITIFFVGAVQNLGRGVCSGSVMVETVQGQCLKIAIGSAYALGGPNPHRIWPGRII